MSKGRKAMCILMGGLAGASVVNAVIDSMNGDNIGCRLALHLSLICLMQIKQVMLEDRLDAQNETIGQMIELLGLMCRIEVVEDEE